MHPILLAVSTTTTDLLNTAGTTYQGASATSPTLVAIILQIIGVAIGLLGIVFLCLLLYAGWNYMIAGGDSDKVETAKHTIVRSVIGLLIVLCSYALLQFVVPQLLCATGITDACTFF